MKLKHASLAVASLVVAATPVLASAATAANTTINATVNSNIAITGTATVTLTLSPTTAAVQSTGSATYSVDTNNSTGYNLKIKDVDATLNLVGTPGGTIVPGTGTQAAPAALSNGQWGWAVVGGGGAGQFDTAYTVANNAAATGKKFAGITATDVQFKSTSTPATADSTTVYYSALIPTTQQQGSYTDQVVVTSTANP